jgi:hypothetical protein
MHHAVQVPLRVDLGATPLVQTGQAFVVPDVSEHRLHRANALTGVGGVFDWTVPSFPRPPFGSPLAAHHVCGMRPLFY